MGPQEISLQSREMLKCRKRRVHSEREEPGAWHGLCWVQGVVPSFSLQVQSDSHTCVTCQGLHCSCQHSSLKTTCGGYSHQELLLRKDNSSRIVFDQLGFPQIFFPKQCLIYTKPFSRELYKFSISFYENTGPGVVMHGCVPDIQKNVVGNMAC